MNTREPASLEASTELLNRVVFGSPSSPSLGKIMRAQPKLDSKNISQERISIYIQEGSDPLVRKLSQSMEHNVRELGSRDIVAKGVRLADLIDYQRESLVSRTIIDKKAGTVTLFAFDEGQRLSEHTAPFDALVHVLDGEAEVVISGRTHLLKEGEMIIMPANEPHSLKAVKRFKMMLTMIRSIERLD